MSTLTKIALGLIGQMHSETAQGIALDTLQLPAPVTLGGLPLMQAFLQRQSLREFEEEALSEQTLSEILWAANGINRPETHGHTAPSAMNAQEIIIYAAMPSGLFRYDAKNHQLHLSKFADVRRVTGYQDFVDNAPLDIIYVVDHTKMMMIPVSKRDSYASIAAGAMAQNVYLYCASENLATVVRAWFDRSALMQVMNLDSNQDILLIQTIGKMKLM